MTWHGRCGVEVLGLGWLGTRTDRYDATLAFFRDVLGLPVRAPLPNGARRPR